MHIVIKELKRVVYVLGAGFSQPLGLPLTSTFLEFANDLLLREAKRYEHFGTVFSLLEQFAATKFYFTSDLTNIEEFFSMAEMRDTVTSANNNQRVKRFISDVIKAYTPSIEQYTGIPRKNVDALLFGSSELDQIYGPFIFGLLGLRLSKGEDAAVRIRSGNYIGTQYAVVSLNYDTVLERHAAHFQALAIENNCIEFKDPENGTGNSDPWSNLGPFIAKLHGCVVKDTIVPPTWNKRVSKEIKAAWKVAHDLLKEATHIRFIGYSLPDTDHYVRYLFKSAFCKYSRLKQIDVICLDSPDGTVERRYREFILFRNLRFQNANTLRYLKNMEIKLNHVNDIDNAIPLDLIESRHERIFS